MKKMARYLDGTPIPRPVDRWREFAAIPLQSMSLSCEGTPATWTLMAGGKLVSHWREVDAPGLGQWIGDTIARYHGAWHLARTELGVVKKKSRGGERSAAARRGPSSKAAKVRKRIAELAESGRDAHALVPRIAKEAGCSARYVREILKAAEKRN